MSTTGFACPIITTYGAVTPKHFQKGVVVRNVKDGRIDVVECVPGDAEYDSVGFISPMIGMVLKNKRWAHSEDYELLDVDDLNKENLSGHI